MHRASPPRWVLAAKLLVGDVWLVLVAPLVKPSCSQMHRASPPRWVLAAKLLVEIVWFVLVARLVKPWQPNVSQNLLSGTIL